MAENRRKSAGSRDTVSFPGGLLMVSGYPAVGKRWRGAVMQAIRVGEFTKELKRWRAVDGF